MFILPLSRNYICNDKYLEENTQALHALRQTLSKEHLSIVSHCDSTFVVWNTLSFLKEQASNIMQREPIVDESEQMC